MGKYAKDAEVLNFGCFYDDNEKYSYIATALLIGMILNCKIVDFVATGCSSGQGMMQACNAMPGVLCGYAPSDEDMYLKVRNRMKFLGFDITEDTADKNFGERI